MAVSVIISGVRRASPAYKSNIKAGDQIVSINGHKVIDVLDYRFLIDDLPLSIKLIGKDGSPKAAVIKNFDHPHINSTNKFDEIGLGFNSYLMDDKRVCQNKCVFCFIDQLPKNMRPSLYLKDDDIRLSFLQGNYISLTNLNNSDIERVKKYNLSPINISVHTTDSKLRCEMLNNKKAGQSLEFLFKLCELGIKINTQIVVCPEINDADKLDKTIKDLAELWPMVQSISVVPVGITKYRSNLISLKPFNKESAGQVVSSVSQKASHFLNKLGTRLVFLADEFYLLSESELPEYDHYEQFFQLENGVGMLALLKHQFLKKLNSRPPKLPLTSRKVTVVTSTSAFDTIKNFALQLERLYKKLDIDVVAVKNDFFGPNITVAGLLTGRDILAAFKDRPTDRKILLPDILLRQGSDILLDDLTIKDIKKELGTKVVVAPTTGHDFIKAILTA